MRLGILSTAKINDRVLAGASAAGDVEVVAVASRDAERARAYAAERGIPRAHGGYEGLLADDEVDTVYVSLPNGRHVEWSIAALEAGKHVLCEKPLTRHVADAERAFDAAQAAGRLLVEAFMWRYNPQTERFARLVSGGAIGELRGVRAAFSFPLSREGDPRLDPELDGGALMDIGCYCVSAARLLAGEPERVSAQTLDTADGVDLRMAAAMRHPGGVLSHFDCAFDLPNRSELEALGSEGSLYTGDPWHARAPRIEVRRGGDADVIELEPQDSYRLELEDLAAAIRDGRPPLLGREDAIGQARAIEALYASAAAQGAPRVP